VLRRPVEFALRSVVGVVHEFVARVAAAQRHDEGGHDEVGRLTFAHRPADQGVVVQVSDPGQVELAVLAPELADVRNPAQIRTFGREVPCEQIRCRDDRGVAALAPLPTPVSADKALVAHQTGHPMP
jgi:hypothetical protein